MLPKALVCAFAAALLAAAQPAVACSVDDAYRVPTNFELVQHADTILLGVIEDGPTDIERMGAEPTLIVRPTLLLKGAPAPDRLRLGGMIAPPRFAVPSDPNELEQAHPLTQIGACIRYMFVRGSTVLFFLRRQGGQLTHLARPFSREAEDVPSPNARWVRAVQLYIEVAALPEPQRRPALIARQAELRARAGDADAQAIADDIDRQLPGPNRSWNAIIQDEIRRMDEQAGNRSKPRRQ